MVKTIDSEWLKNDLVDVHRWEDEGGQMIENNVTMPDWLSVPPVSISAGMRDTSLQWNERFIIEPSQPGFSILLIRKKHATTTD
jgi:hypothetical protein